VTDATDVVLLVLMLMVIGVSLTMIATSNITPEERDEMLRDEEMWP